MNRRRSSSSRAARSTRTDRIFGVASARSVKRGQRPWPRRDRPVYARERLTGRVRARVNEWIDRWAERASDRSGASSAIGLIGLDVAQPPSRLRTRSWAGVAAAAVAGMMFLAVLRVDVIRMRFSVAEAFEEELRLEEVKRELTVEMRRLRDPAVLVERAGELGFRRAERLIDVGAAPPRPRVRRPEPRGGEAFEMASAIRAPRPRP
jgi:hypothetical protein